MFTKPVLPFAAALMCAAGPALAASLTLTSIQGIWSSSTPTVEGVGTEAISWGEPAETHQSGYEFSHVNAPLTVEDNTQFVIGDFTHNNYPIFGETLKSAELEVMFSIVGLDDPISSTFSFLHNETVNNHPICADGGANYSGVNTAGCADLVTATLNLGQSEVFAIDGAVYVLDIIGFQHEGAILTDFWTQESQSNLAQLVAVFSTVEGKVSEVPLPASALLLLGGLLTLRLKRRKA